MAKINIPLMELRFQDLTGCNAQQAQRAINRYCVLAVQQCWQHMTKPAPAGQVYVSSTIINRTLDCVRVKGQDHRIWTTIQENIPERIFTPVNKGSNLTGQLSLMELNYDLEDIIIASGSETDLVQHLYAPHADAISADRYDQVCMDMQGLSSYIQGNRAHPARHSDRANPRLLEQLDRNLRHAVRLEMIGRCFDGQLFQVRTLSNFGRIYYTGPNLQNTPRMVRHAALGACHEYDIESSVFAWKMSETDQILRSRGDRMIRPATLEYLDHKRAIRERLSRLLWDSEDEHWQNIIKQAITAMGFGARRSRGYRGEDGHYQPMAMEQIITSSVLLERFMQDPWVQEFVAEQQQMNQLILDHYQPDQIHTWRQIPGLVNSRGSIRPSSVISYLYQHQERAILEWLMAQAQASEVLLTVHDCIYTRRAIKLVELRAGIREFGDYYDIDHTVIQPYRYDRDLEEHHRRIQEEELRAQQHYGITAGSQAQRPQRRTQIPTQPEGTYLGGCYTGDNYDPESDPAVEDPLAYAAFRRSVIDMPTR